MRLLPLISLFVIIVLSLVSYAQEPLILVRVRTQDASRASLTALSSMSLDFASPAITDHADVIVNSQQRAHLERIGYDIEIIQYENEVLIPPEYHRVSQTWEKLKNFHARYPDITALDTCGYSQRNREPILHLTISNNPGVQQDKPGALFNAMVHAREPMGNEIILYTIEWLLTNYPTNAQARKYVDSMELHFIPIANPDGWNYICNNNLGSPWWRKNCRDNRNSGGAFNPNYDGVDLNRNWDWRWSQLGESNPSNWQYYGPAGNSEGEVRAIVNVARKQRPVVGISYHSYGPFVMYPYEYNGLTTPDQQTIHEIAVNMTTAIGGGYQSPRRLTGAGQGSVYLYGELGILDFTVETSTSFIPTVSYMTTDRARNFNGLCYLLDRCFYSGVTGHVLDSLTREPLQATVEVLNSGGDAVTPRMSDSTYGRFYRLLKNGTCSMRFSKQNYRTKSVANIRITADSLVYLEVLMQRDGAAINPHTVAGHRTQPLALPNPFTKSITIYPATGIISLRDIALFDAKGALVTRLRPATDGTFIWNGTNSAGREVKPGIYFCTSAYDGNMVVTRLIKAR